MTSGELAMLQVQEGSLVWSDNRNWDRGTWDVYLIHGRWDAVPYDLALAAMRLTRYRARQLNNADEVPDRVSVMSTEGGTMTFSFPTLARPTGLPAVDVVLQRYAMATALQLQKV